MIEWQAKKRWWPLLHRDVGTLIVLNDTVARLIVNRSPHFSRWENNYFTRRGRVVLIMHVEGVVGGWGSTRSFGRCRSTLEEGERTIGRELGDWSSFACRIGDFQMMHITWGCHMRTHMYVLQTNYMRRHLAVTVVSSSFPPRIYSLFAPPCLLV